ncbi:MAG: acetyltransferase [Sphingobacteriaceae bacterium]|nr:MAG: acetyltransferase [Sphingobacteriaceae bacterium]
MKLFSLGKILISIVSLYAAFGSYIFDWNKTHIFNPDWPPHAKFHNAQDMLLGTTTGLLALWVLWIQRTDERNKLILSAVLASLYWITQFGAVFFPGTALVDPQFAQPDQLPAQLIVDIIMVAMLTVACLLERKKLIDVK